MAIATLPDVEARLGRSLEGDEATLATALLEDTEVIILSRIPLLPEYIATGRVSERAVKMVESNAVIRVLKNPDGFQSEQEGDYLYSRVREVASGYLTITDEEWTLLGRHGAFTITPVLAHHHPHPHDVPPYAWQWSWPAEGWRQWYSDWVW